MIRKTIFATAAFAVSQTAAFATETVVQFDRDRLDDVAYVEALYAELEDAATAVCKKELLGSPLYLSMLRSCIETTLEESVKKIASPTLTAYADDEAPPVRMASKQ